MIKLDRIIEASNQFKVVPKINVARVQSQDTVEKQQIELLKELIKEIEEQRCAQGCVPKSLHAPAAEARQYYRGMNAGVYLALRVINERIGRMNNALEKQEQ